MKTFCFSPNKINIVMRKLKKRKKVIHTSSFYFIWHNISKTIKNIFFTFILILNICIFSFLGCKPNVKSKKLHFKIDKKHQVYNDSTLKSKIFINDSILKFNLKNNKKDSLNTKLLIKSNIIDSLYYIKKLLYNEVNIYIKKYAPKSKMSSKKIVDACLENNYDIPLLLSQAHVESTFGTTTKKVFGIQGKHYSHPNNAIIDYIKLMQSKYIRTRSINKALNSGLNVEGTKYKYAATDEYASKIKLVRSKIKNNTDIDNLTNLLLVLKKQARKNNIKV